MFFSVDTSVTPEGETLSEVEHTFKKVGKDGIKEANIITVQNTTGT